MRDNLTPFDRQPIPGASLDVLDLSLVQRHIAVARERGRYSGEIDPQAYLINHAGVVERAGALVPTVAGTLMFAHEPERWVSASGIDLAQFVGPAPRSTGLRFMEQIRGQIPVIIDRTVQLLWARSEHGYRIEGAQRIEEHAYPEVVLRELTVNALCHRDWSQAGSRVRIQMLPAYIEWISPGSLPAGVTLQNLRTAQVSRNRALAVMLFHAGYVEEFGIGMDTVFDTLRDANHEPPWIQDDGAFFTFRVAGKPIHAGVTSSLLPPVDARKANILAAIEQQGPMTIRELQEQLQIARRTLQRDLQELVDKGYLRITGATNNLRYYLGAPDAR